MDPGLVACIRAGAGYSAQAYIAMRASKLAYVERQHRFMADWDLLLTPSVSVAAFPAERLQPAHWPEHPWDWISWSEFCYPFNMSGLPAASIPCGFTPGRPCQSACRSSAAAVPMGKCCGPRRHSSGRDRGRDSVRSCDATTADYSGSCARFLPTASAQKNTNVLTTTFLRHGASSGAVGSTQAVWKDQRDMEPSVTES